MRNGHSISNLLFSCATHSFFMLYFYSEIFCRPTSNIQLQAEPFICRSHVLWCILLFRIFPCRVHATTFYSPNLPFTQSNERHVLAGSVDRLMYICFSSGLCASLYGKKNSSNCSNMLLPTTNPSCLYKRAFYVANFAGEREKWMMLYRSGLELDVA